MKKRVYILFFLIGMVLIGGCKDDNIVIVPETGGNGEMQEEDTVIHLTHFVYGEYYGDNGNGTNFISMMLSDGLEWDRVTENYTKSGRYIFLELNSQIRSDYMLATGTYKPIPKIGSLVGTFNPGKLECSDGPCYAVSTYLSDVDRNGREIFTALTDGKIVVSKKENDIYSIVMDLKDEEGYPVHAVYEGKLPLIFVGYKFEPQEAVDQEFLLEQVERVEYWGDFFRNGTSDFLLDFTTADGKYGIGLELYCPKEDRVSITSGDYVFSVEERAMTAKPGYYNGYGTLYPGYAYKLGTFEYEIVWWLSQGKVKIDQLPDEVYHIQVDAYSFFGSHIKAVYNGKLNISDATVPSESKAKLYNRMKGNNNINKRIR